MSKLSLAQSHGIASFFESLLVGAGPLLVTLLGGILSFATWFALQAQNCTTSLPAPAASGLCSAPGITKVIPVFLVLWPFLQWLLPALIRGVQGWLIVKHAPIIDAPPDLAEHPGTPVSSSVQAVILVKPASTISTGVSP